TRGKAPSSWRLSAKESSETENSGTLPAAGPGATGGSRLSIVRASLAACVPSANCGQSLAMRILVVGGGGREHALCWAISASPLCTKLYCAPGNAGIAQLAECIDVAAEDIAGQVALAQREKIDFVVVGPEVPLAAGLADRLAEAGLKVF